MPFEVGMEVSHTQPNDGEGDLEECRGKMLIKGGEGKDKLF